MHIFHIDATGVCADATALSSDTGFLWLDASHDEVAADSAAWCERVAQLSGGQLHELHLKDALNLSHPSYFEDTDDYRMLVFRQLSLQTNKPTETPPAATAKLHIPAALHKLTTAPVSFFLIGRCLVSVGPQHSRTIEQARTRLLNYKLKSDGASMYSSRLPESPADLMLRLLNGMVDQYLELRQPLTQQLDRWQHALLDPRRPFNNWLALLDARLELRKLDHLCEEQHDAMQELRDHLIDAHDLAHTHERARSDLLLVRINDVIEHINRVLNHARRLEASLESAVQIHFAAMAHRTSEIMRILTVITAIFMPLTLITGIFGMNFEVMPLLKQVAGFWIIMGSMLAIVLGLLFYFYRQRYLSERGSRR